MTLANRLRTRHPHHRPIWPHPPLPTRRDADNKIEQAYVLEVILDVDGEPIGEVELSLLNNNNGVPSARYTDGNGYTNHGVLGEPGDLITFTTNGCAIVTSTAASPYGPAYYVLTDAPVQRIVLSVEPF